MTRYWCPYCNEYIPEKWKNNHEALIGHYLEPERPEIPGGDEDDDGVR